MLATLARFKQFNKDFWIINGIELLERGAYYSLAPLLGLFMRPIFVASGMSEGDAVALAGTITAVSFLLLYAVPLFAAALAEKYGYRAALFVSFALLAIGYATTWIAGTVVTIVAAVVAIGFGAGIFKPIAAAMVSQTTREDQRNAGFAIYYGCINLGAFIFPTFVAVAAYAYARFVLGATLTPEVLTQTLVVPIAIGTATLLSLVNFILILTVFRNVTPPRRDVPVLGAFAMLGDVFKHPAFLVLLIIYSGFWFVYAMALGTIQLYMVDFARMPDWFSATLIVSINAGVIILAAPLIAVLTGRFNSIGLMTVGILGYSLGMVVLGFSGTPLFFVGGILIFSLFELVTHPSYLAYVSKIAPPDKVSIYLGYGFLPIAVGLMLGSSVGGALYGRIALDGGNPSRFWAIIAAVGLVTVAALLIYNMFLTRSRDKSDAVVAGTVARRRGVGFFVGPVVAAIAVVLLIPALLAGATLAGTNAAGGDLSPLATDLANFKLDPVEDITREGQSSKVTLTLPPEAVGAAGIVLAWKDEPAQPGATNQPDRFMVHVTLPDGTTLQSPEETRGEIRIPLEAMPGDYVIEVHLIEAGDHVIALGPIPVTVPAQADTENAWTLEMSYQAPAEA